MRLFIAEKPSLAKAIFEGLGGNPSTEKKNGFFHHGNDVVTWCFGHMLALCDPQDYDPKYQEWKLEDLPIKAVVPPRLKPIASSKAQLNIILQLIGKAQVIVGAGDPDEEGQLLVDEILTYCKNTKPVERLLVADLNLKSVQKSLANMRPNSEFQHMTQSALARSIGDQLFGYNLTRAYTLKGRTQGYDGVLSVGRVQSAVLGLVNSRTLANANHNASFYYDVSGQFKFNDAAIIAKYQPTENDDIDEKKRIINENSAKSIQALCTNKTSSIVSAQTKPESKAAPLPYNLSSLQQTCAKRYGMSAQETLDTIQSLYETHKLLTYPRSDCRYLSNEHFASATQILTAIAHTTNGIELVKKCNPQRKHKTFNDKKITAHHAIIPTEKNGKGVALTDIERKVYNLVAINFVALFYPDSTRNKTRVVIDCEGKQFVATHSVTTEQGWETLFKAEQAEEKNSNAFDLSLLNNGDNANCNGIAIQPKKTTPPKYFVASSLLAAMSRAAKFIEDPELRKVLEEKDKNNSAEAGSIGTEATRAGILEKLAENPLISIEECKGYKEKIWKTTKQGQEFCALLPKEIIAPDTSAIWAQRQEQIRQGNMTVKVFTDALDEYIADQVKFVKENKLNLTIEVTHCPKCKTGILGRRKGSNGIFWACNSYPDCKTSYPDKRGKPDLKPKAKGKYSKRTTKKPVKKAVKA